MINNANIVLHKFLPSWNIGLSVQTLFLQNPQGHHVLVMPLESILVRSLMSQIRYFIQRIKALFAPRPVNNSMQSYRVVDLKSQNGNLWLGLAYGPRPNMILWRKA